MNAGYLNKNIKRVGNLWKVFLNLFKNGFYNTTSDVGNWHRDFIRRWVNFSCCMCNAKIYVLKLFCRDVELRIILNGFGADKSFPFFIINCHLLSFFLWLCKNNLLIWNVMGQVLDKKDLFNKFHLMNH